MRARRFDGWLASAVLGHFLVSVFHGRAHDGGQVALSTAQSLFVYIVILAMPFVGLATAFVRPRLGGAIVGASMAASLLFGLINHFLVLSPDHVSQVASEWRPLFTSTAILLIITE